MILSFTNIRKVPREVLKTSGFARDLANVNEWKIMFDPYNAFSYFIGNTNTHTKHREFYSYPNVKFGCNLVSVMHFTETARMHRLICAFVVRK